MKRLCKIAVIILVAGVVLAAAGGIWGGNLYVPWDRGNTADWETPSGRSNVTEVSGFSADALGKVTALDLDLDAVEFVIEEGPDWKLESDFSDRYLTTRLDGGTLYIKTVSSRPWWKNNRHHTVVLTVPEGAELDLFDCTLDAGSVEIDRVTAARTLLDVDAGSLKLDTLYGGSLEASCDAGSIDLSARLTEDSSLDCDAGSIGLTLLDGSALEYVRGDVDLGSVRINRKEYDGISSGLTAPLTSRALRSGRTLELDCDVGSVEIVSEY